MQSGLELPVVLIVDDESSLRDALARLMSSQNIQFEVAENGKVAIEKMISRDFHAIICDIMMPEMTGLECLAEAQVQGIVAPFIFLTGYGDSERMLQAIRLGAIDFISKPFDNDEVMDVVFRTLDIGARRNQILHEIKDVNSELLSKVKRSERMISLMRINNNKKRIVG